MNIKRKISVLAPYKIKDGFTYIFLQKRSKDAKRAPELFGFFGGGIEDGETREEALIREIKEELDIDIKNFIFFNKYERHDAFMNLFIMEVDDNFEGKINILEGDYGKWFGKEDFIQEELINKDDIPMLQELYNNL